MIQPQALKKGDKIAIIATAKAINPEDVQKAKQVFEEWGLKVIFGKNLFEKHHQFAGTDQQRLEDLQWALDNQEIKAVICARGGYGTTRFLDQIDFTQFKKSPKFIGGFSDVTALISKINNLGIEAIHSTMPIFFNLGISDASLESLKNVLFGKQLSYNIPHNPLNRIGKSKAEIVGGNLSILCNSLGTSSELNTKNKILFIEDLTEYLYHIDRMMVQLKRANKLKHLKGLIVGHFSKLTDNEIPFGKNANEIILEHCSNYSFPIIFDFPVGHEPENWSIICGRKVKLKTSKTVSKIIFD